MKADLVIRGGTVVDGSGGPSYRADVVVEGDRIAQIGRYNGPALQEIDARGKIVTPGFVDIHTHLDAQLAWDPLGSPSPLHGVTTAVVGNCGVGFAPCRERDRDYLMFLMEGVEDIPAAAMKAGMRWEWETFPEYLSFLERTKLGINIGAHVSHAPLRIFAMGERGATDVAASDDELAVMRRELVTAMRAGALGIATGRTTMHRTPAWDPVPGTFADQRELGALGGALADAGTGVFEMVLYGAAGEDAAGFEREYPWMVPMSLETGRPLSFGLIQNFAYPDVWRDILHKVERAAQAGARLVPQVAVRSVGILMGYGTSVNALSMFPAAFEIIGKPRQEVLAWLRLPETHAQLLASVRDASGDILGGMATVDLVFPLDFSSDRPGVFAYETSAEHSVAAIGRRLGIHWGEVILDHLIKTELRGFLMVPLFNHDLDAAAEMLRHPLTGIGLGDSGAHTSQTCDAGFPTFTLGYWVRQKKVLSLEQAVRKLSFDNALTWGIRDRGLLRRGAFADLNVIDLDRVDLLPPELKHEFPTGAPHLSQGAVGYDATVVNGAVLMRNGAPTGSLPGRLVKNEMC